MSAGKLICPRKKRQTKRLRSHSKMVSTGMVSSTTSATFLFTGQTFSPRIIGIKKAQQIVAEDLLRSRVGLTPKWQKAVENYRRMKAEPAQE